MNARVGVVGCGIIAKAYVEGSAAFLACSRSEGEHMGILDYSENSSPEGLSSLWARLSGLLGLLLSWR